ncbi:MAG: GNAT family N-acetyltransferase [Proteobacteria bacterium]|nr:GNAT family N-acetyltransferase [Pseudomonadota bacterium]NIS71460.1 GNAT family N-acetyltransferase [Pseudomonadota bacterium]
MIRRFEPTDLNEILQIEAQAFPKSSYTAEMFFDFYRCFSETFLVFEEDRVLGYIIFEPSGHVISLAVDPPHRRKGIGTHLMQVCEAHCKGDTLFVEVRIGNVGAQKFYERLGFHLKSKIRLYYRTEDAYLMEKKGPRRD